MSSISPVRLSKQLAPAAAVLLTLSGCSHPQGMEDSPVLLRCEREWGVRGGGTTQRQIFIERVGESEIVA